MARRFAGVGALARHCFVRFFDDDCLIAASALSYTTIVSLVPLAALILAIVSGFSMFGAARERFLVALLDNLAPDIGDQAVTWFQAIVQGAAQTTAIGVGALVVTSLLLLATIEDRLQHIWHVSSTRPWRQRVLAYWMVLTLGPVLIGIGFSLPDYLYGLSERTGLGALAGEAVLTTLARGVSFGIEALSFMLLFSFIPNCDVRWHESAAGAVLAAVVIELLKVGYALFVFRIASYGVVYGALAGIPIFLLWMYIFWAVVLAGAEVAAGLRERRLSGGDVDVRH